MDPADLPPVPPKAVAAPASQPVAPSGGTVFQPITVPPHMAGMIGAVVAAPPAATRKSNPTFDRPGDALRRTREIGDRLRAAAADFTSACETFLSAVKAAEAHAKDDPVAASLWKAEGLDLSQAAEVAREAGEALDRVKPPLPPAAA
jgi:hypothetical protein